MTLVIPTGFAEASVELRNEGDPQPWYITCGIGVGDAEGAWGDVAANVAGSWAEAFAGSFSTSTSITGVRLTIGQDGPDNLTVFVAADYTGGSTEAKLPQNCALLIDKGSAFGGRKNRGRFFVPNVLSESQVNNVGVIDGSVVTSFQEQADTLLEDFTTGVIGLSTPRTPTPMFILHNSATPDPTPVNRLTVQGVISTQRRRLR